MTLKPKLEAIIYAAEDPVTLNELASLLKDEVLAELRAEEEARLALNQTISDDAAIRDEYGDDTGLTPPLEEQFFAEEEASSATPTKATPTKGQKQPEDKEQLKAVKAYLSSILGELVADYA